MSVHKHYKMFKKGKKWCYMAIATLSVAVGVMSFTQKVSADTNISNTENVSNVSVSTEKTQDTQNQNTANNQLEGIEQVPTQEQLSDNTTEAGNKLAVSPQATTIQSGWQTEDGSSYYYRDGQKLTGQQNINGKDYYFNDQGQQQKDYFLNQDNHTYYFQADGTRLNDGFYNNWGHTYYFQADGSRLDNGFYNNWGHTYYFQADGSRLDDGFYNNWGHTYYFQADGSRLDDGFYNDWGHTYYFQADGSRLDNGFYNNWGHTYYFQADGSRLDDGFYNNWGHTYYFQADGSRLDNGFYNNWGNVYYFGSDGALTTNKDIMVNGVNYRADNSGVLTSPEFSINYTYGLANGEGSDQIAANDYIIMHDVGVESGAAANARYFKNNWQSVDAYTQFVVGDGGQVFEVGQPGYVSWGALAANPYSPVQIELGRTYNRNQFIKDYTAYINVARYYATVYNIPLALDAGNAGTRGVKTHNWVTQNIGGSHVDPYGYLASWGITRNQFANDIENGINAQQLNSVVYYSRK
ncbi:N-acetylmuramoyl-L-alanine amidase [Limosilactobacillus reuteri]|nr:N-acetylmuramoyl-L-alanine amidase [Limosilactobacillus reuteri]AXX74867.1 N-acetylmuramoyl-L-alanine amidase [Limosilactobacillus reuteri]